MGACEPGQVRKEAALSGYFHVPWGSPSLRSYREINEENPSHVRRIFLCCAYLLSSSIFFI